MTALAAEVSEEARYTKAVGAHSAIDFAYYNGLPVPHKLDVQLEGTDADAAAELAAWKQQIAGRFLCEDFSYGTCFGFRVDTGGASISYTKIRDVTGAQS